MKLRTTTPASISFIRKVSLILVGLSLLAFIPVQFLNQDTKACSTIEQCDAEIAAREREIAEYSSKTDALNKKALSLESTLAELSNQKAIIQAQLDISQAKYNKLQKQIIDTEKKIRENKDALGQVIADLYVDDKITPIEMLASSNTISDYLDKQEYRSSVRSELTSTIDEIEALKEDLEKQRDKVASVLKEQKQQRDSLAVKEAEQSNLLSVTKGQESIYKDLINKSEAEIAKARATQSAISNRMSGGGGYVLINSGLLSDYGWNESNCPMWSFYSTGGADGNGGDGYGYGCRQCASYVAWKIAKETGRYYSWGNAINFTANAKAAGYVEGDPRDGSIAVMDVGYYGHVAWVEAVSDGQVLISQYNYNYGAGWGMYSEMWLPISAFDHYIHIK